MANPGVYLLKRNGIVAYVGRSDTDVDSRARQSYSEGSYDQTYEIRPLSSPREAYYAECRLYHFHDPIDNSNHPAVPASSGWRCPVEGCPWS